MLVKFHVDYHGCFSRFGIMLFPFIIVICIQVRRLRSEILLA